MSERDVPASATGIYAERGHAVLTWLLTGTRNEPSLDGLLAAFCLELRMAGFPVMRTVLQLHTHHPQWLGSRIVWRSGMKEADVQPIEYGVMQTPMYLNSPVAALARGSSTGTRLDMPPLPDEYPLCAGLRREGLTDYVAWPLLFTLDRMHTISFASDRPGGFANEELERSPPCFPRSRSSSRSGSRTSWRAGSSIPMSVRTRASRS